MGTPLPHRMGLRVWGGKEGGGNRGGQWDPPPQRVTPCGNHGVCWERREWDPPQRPWDGIEGMGWEGGGGRRMGTPPKG